MSLTNLLSTSILLKRIIPITITTMLFIISGDLKAEAKPKTPNQNTNQTVTGRKFLEMHLKEITQKGYSGTYNWCVKSEINASSLFTPTQYKILDNYGDNKSYFATVTIHSSNKGGSPIVNNWRFWIIKGATLLEQEMKKAGSSSSSINNLRKDIGGWCIFDMSEN